MSINSQIDFVAEENLVERLRKEKELSGVPVSEILRRAADEYLKKRENASNP